MRLDPDIAQELLEAALDAGAPPGPVHERLWRAIDAARANDEANRRVVRAELDGDWHALVTEALRASDGKADVAQARRVMEALESAGISFPQRGRRDAPQTPEDHLWEAARLLEMSLTHDDTGPGGYHVWDDHCRAQVGAAEVHARIGHAWSALAMLARAEQQPAPDAPGLAALEKLAAAVEQLAAGARPLDVVFDGPPSAVAGRFVEVEDTDGRSVKAGEWLDRGDGTWALRLHVVQTEYRRT